MGNNLEDENQIYWRDKRLSERLGFALEHDKLYKDVHFILGKHEIRISAHKLILRLSSLVLENIITAHEQQGINEIRLPNTSPEMFSRLLKFIYKDEMEIGNLSGFLSVAKEFGFTKLEEQTLGVLKKLKINSDNAVYLLDIGKGLRDQELESNSLNYIVDNAESVLNSPNFVQISYKGLCQILLEDRLSVEEMEVFRAAIRWGEFQCTKATLPQTPDNLRNFLKDARLYIRYFQIDYEDILTEVKPTGILLSSEFIQVLKHFVDPTVNLLGLPTKPRAVLPSTKQKQLIQQISIDEDDVNDVIPNKMAKIDNTNHTSNYSNGGPPPPADDRTTEFRMYSTFIDFRDFLDSIQVRYGVSKVILNDVIFQNAECYRGRRVHLPNLETFYYYLKQDDPSTTGQPTQLPDRNFMCGLTTKEFLFFEKDRIVPWDLQNLWGMGIEVIMHVKGLRLMDLNHQTKELTLSFPPADETAPIFHGLTDETELRSLCVTGGNFTELTNLRAVFSPTAAKLTTLVLQGVEFQDATTATDFINLFPNLKNLSLYIVNNISIDLQTDLQQRATLEKITLSKVNFKTYKKKKGVVPFVKCEELYLDVCDWPPALGDHFSMLFPKLRRIVIRSMGHCRCSARLFTEMLEIRPLKTIAIYKYPGMEDPAFTNPNINIFIPPSGVNKIAVQKFLVKAGIQLPGNGPEVPNFILEKNFDANRWNTVSDPENTLFDQMHFELSMLDRFFDNRQTTRLVQ